MISGYFKRRKTRYSGSGQQFESGEWVLGRHPNSLADLQKEIIRGDRNHIIFVTDPNVEPMRVITRSDYECYQNSIKSNTLELYSYRNNGGDEI